MNPYRYLSYSIIFAIIGFGVWIGMQDSTKIVVAIRQIAWSGFGFLCLFSMACSVMSAALL